MTDASATQSATKRVIRPGRGWVSLRLRELWIYRELLYFLTWRDVKVRYKQAVLGVAWAVLQPVISMVVFTAVFGWLLHLPSPVEGQPYAVAVFVAQLPWQLFAGALQKSGTSLVGNAALITKVYFPRLVIPISAVLGGLVDFVLAFLVLACLMAVYGIVPGWQIVLLPVFILLAMLTALAVGLWLSALNVLYRDVQYIIPFLIQLWFFLSPVVYSVPDKPVWLNYLYALNPLTGVIAAFRWALIDGPAPDALILVSSAVVLVLFMGGLYYFKRMERQFADVV